MNKYLSMFRLVVIALAIVAIGALLGWYFFLAGKSSQVQQQNTGTGDQTVAPSFQGTTGSTYANVVSTLGVSSGASTVSTSSRLWEVSAVPVAGFGWRTGQAPGLYFVERSSGYVFDAQTQNHSVVRLTNTLRPKTYEAWATLDGSVVERGIDDNGNLITFAGKVATSSSIAVTGSVSTSSSDLSGTDLPTGISAVAVDPSSDTLFYLVPGASSVQLISTNFAGQKERQLFSSALTGWQLLAPGDGTVYLLQNPLDGVLGYAYQIGKTGSLSAVAQGPGLTILPRASSGMMLLGSSSSDGALALFVRASASAPAVSLPIRTVADKCAWAPGQNAIAYCGVPKSVPSQQFLDDWYKGLVHTSDTIYQINASDASSSLLYDPTGDTSAQLDVEYMSVDPSGQYLAFINAKDQSLWVLRIAQ